MRQNGWMSQYEFDEYIVGLLIIFEQQCRRMCIGFAKLMLDNQFNKVADNSLNTSVACGHCGHEMRKSGNCGNEILSATHTYKMWYRIGFTQDSVFSCLFFHRSSSLWFCFRLFFSWAVLSVTFTTICYIVLAARNVEPKYAQYTVQQAKHTGADREYIYLFRAIVDRQSCVYHSTTYH